MYLFQSHSCCNKKRTCWIVATINPISCRPCVHPSTFSKVLIDKFCSSNRREIIIFAHNYFRKTQTNKASHHLDFYLSIVFHCKRIRYFKPIAINTRIDCANNSKCSARYILKATARSLESVLLKHFLLD